MGLSALSSPLLRSFKDFVLQLQGFTKNLNCIIDNFLQFPKLRDLYHESYRQRGDLDEIQFLDNDPHLLPKGIV